MYHPLGRSSYPACVSIHLLGLMSSLVVFFKYGVLLGVLLSSAGLAVTVYMWFVTNTLEGFSGANSFNVADSVKFSFGCFILSEVMFFFGVFWCYFDSALSPSLEIGGSWSPMGIVPVNPLGIPLFNTVILLTSSFTLTCGYSRVMSGGRPHAFMYLTLILAAMFEVGQYLEYVNSSFSMSDGIYGSAFYFGTGFHGLHVIIGHVFLAVNTFILSQGWMSRMDCTSLDLAVVYWHFVDVVWLFLFMSMYVWAYGL